LNGQIKNLKNTQKEINLLKEFSSYKDKKVKNAKEFLSLFAPQKHINRELNQTNELKGDNGGFTPMISKRTPLLTSRKRMSNIQKTMNNSDFLHELARRRKLIKQSNNLEVIKESPEKTPDPLDKCISNFLYINGIHSVRRSTINRQESFPEGKKDQLFQEFNKEEVKKIRNIEKSPKSKKFQKEREKIQLDPMIDKKINELCRKALIIKEKSEKKENYNGDIKALNEIKKQNLKLDLKIASITKEGINENNENMNDKEYFRLTNSRLFDKNYSSTNLGSILSCKNKEQERPKTRLGEEVRIKIENNRTTIRNDRSS